MRHISAAVEFKCGRCHEWFTEWNAYATHSYECKDRLNQPRADYVSREKWPLPQPGDVALVIVEQIWQRIHQLPSEVEMAHALSDLRFDVRLLVIGYGLAWEDEAKSSWWRFMYRREHDQLREVPEIVAEAAAP